MRRADRLFQIVQILRGGRLTTAAALAARLEVSERTIYRDVADLQSTGVPIDGEAGVGYLMREGFDLPPLMFTRDEVAAVIAGARLIRAFGGVAMALAAEEAIVKIEAVLPEDARSQAKAVQVHAMGWDMDATVRGRLDALQSAIDDRVRLTVSYTDLEGVRTDRTLRPLGLWFWGKVWTLVAWCELRHDFRMFRVDRLADPMQPGARFKPEAGQTLADFYRTMRVNDRTSKS